MVAVLYTAVKTFHRIKWDSIQSQQLVSYTASIFYNYCIWFVLHVQSSFVFASQWTEPWIDEGKLKFLSM